MRQETDAPRRPLHSAILTRSPGGSQTRFKGAGSHKAVSKEQVSLASDHKAITGKTTLFPTMVVSAADSPRLLVSGANAAKLGRVVTVGPLTGAIVYHLTLVERETCPPSCDLWRACFGNSTPLSRRHRPDRFFLPRLDRELRTLAAKHARTGFLVRLHGLGDFYSEDYVWHWVRWLRDLPDLHVFGYTAHPRASRIGMMIDALNRKRPEQWSVRFSVMPDAPKEPMQATTVWGEEPERSVGRIVCPAQRGKADCCAECGLCWWQPAKDYQIAFLGHGMGGGGRPRGPADG